VGGGGGIAPLLLTLALYVAQWSATSPIRYTSEANTPVVIEHEAGGCIAKGAEMYLDSELNTKLKETGKTSLTLRITGVKAWIVIKYLQNVSIQRNLRH
jgi:hypothetical protein